ncbi:MAG: nucleotidyltransferase family protein [Anaerolineales bacterium]|nr:nucleotidyltransferase family protein [Anaerolineales bacterium]
MSSEAVEWEELRPIAAAGGVAPLLYAVLAGRELAPLALETWLQQAFTACYARSMFMLVQLEEMLHSFNNAGIPVLLLKGAALIVTVYRQAGLRPMTDLDLLVRQADVARAIALLGSLGFTPLHHDPRMGTAFAYENEIMLRGPQSSGVLVELHWSLFDSPHHQVHIDMDWFWRTAQPVKVGEADADVLCPEALLLHLCGHLALHHRGETKLLWKHDIAEVIAHYEATIDWTTVIQRAQQYDLVTPLQEILPACAQEWGVAIPAGVVSAVCELEPTARERRALTRLAAAHGSVAGRFWTDIAGLPGWRTRAGYAWENLFPSANFMRSRYTVHAPYLVPLYYPYRWLVALRSARPARARRTTRSRSWP